MIRSLIYFTLVCAFYGGALLFASGFLGAIHPLGDSLSIFRIPSAMLIALTGALLIQRSFWFGVVAVFALIGLSGHYLYRINPSPPSGTVLSLYQKNLSFRLKDAEAIIADIETLQPDFVTLQEVTERNLMAIGPLAESYTTFAACPFGNVGGVAVLSKFEAVQILCQPMLGAVSAQLDTPNGLVWVNSVHIHWPYPYKQQLHMSEVLEQLSTLSGPQIIGGDFNMVPWGHSVSEARALGLKRLSHTRTTFRMEWIIPISIDHVLGSFKRGTTDIRPYLGSDHLGVFVRFPIDD